MLDGNLKENLQKLSQLNSQNNYAGGPSSIHGMGGYGSSNKCLSNINENSHLSINPEYLSSFTDIENIRELMQNTQGGGTAINGAAVNSGLGVLGDNGPSSISQQEAGSALLNDSREAVRDFKMPEERDNIYDILDPHNVRKCLEESKQSKGSQDMQHGTRYHRHQHHPNSSSGGGYGALSHSGKYPKDHNRSFEIDQNELMKAMNLCESRQKGV